jgi:formylglycine-generating enzyme required for sulfatase activity
MLYAGSLVFTPPRRPVDLKNFGEWWTYLKDANWRHPYGPKSNINALDNHPVVHVAYSDALAYAKWAGKELPTEAECESAARGGLDGAEFAWGHEFTPSGRHMANTWQGNFPNENLCEDGFDRTSPVTAFPPNGYGVHDMIGNVWEWTTDWWSAKHQADAPKACCVPENPRGSAVEGSYDPCQPAAKIPRKVIKAAHTCVLRITAAATDRQLAMRKTWIRPQATWDFDVSFERGDELLSNTAIGGTINDSRTKTMARSACGCRRRDGGEFTYIRPTGAEAQHSRHHGR